MARHAEKVGGQDGRAATVAHSGQELPLPTFFSTSSRIPPAMHPMAKVEALKALRSNIFRIIKLLTTSDTILHRRRTAAPSVPRSCWGVLTTTDASEFLDNVHLLTFYMGNKVVFIPKSISFYSFFYTKVQFENLNQDCRADSVVWGAHSRRTQADPQHLYQAAHNLQGCSLNPSPGLHRYLQTHTSLKIININL